MTALGMMRSPIPLFLTDALLLSQDSITLGNAPVANMANWNTYSLMGNVSKNKP